MTIIKDDQNIYLMCSDGVAISAQICSIEELVIVTNNKGKVIRDYYNPVYQMSLDDPKHNRIFYCNAKILFSLNNEMGNYLGFDEEHVFCTTPSNPNDNKIYLTLDEIKFAFANYISNKMNKLNDEVYRLQNQIRDKEKLLDKLDLKLQDFLPQSNQS